MKQAFLWRALDARTRDVAPRNRGLEIDRGGCDEKGLQTTSTTGSLANFDLQPVPRNSCILCLSVVRSFKSLTYWKEKKGTDCTADREDGVIHCFRVVIPSFACTRRQRSPVHHGQSTAHRPRIFLASSSPLWRSIHNDSAFPTDSSTRFHAPLLARPLYALVNFALVGLQTPWTRAT